MRKKELERLLEKAVADALGLELKPAAPGDSRSATQGQRGEQPVSGERPQVAA